MSKAKKTSGAVGEDDKSVFPPFMTTREAARYCGFKNAGGLRKAKHDGRVFAAGRRYGTKILIWRREDLDRYLFGLPPVRVADGEEVIQDEGVDDEQGDEVEEAVEVVGRTDQATGRMGKKGRRLPRQSTSEGSRDEDPRGDQEGAPQRDGDGGLRVASEAGGTGSRWKRLAAESQDALLRIQRFTSGKKGGDQGDQKRKGP